MNPHYHPYTELNSPHSPPPDNNNYHGHPQHGHPPHPHHPGSQPHGTNPMSNGHVMGPHPGGPGGPNNHHHHHPPGSTGPPPHPGPHHDHHQHPHHQHPPFGSGGPLPGGPMHHPHHHHLNNNNNNNSNNNNCPTVKVCAGCGGKIVERFLLHALDRYWHNGCLKCSCCGAMLADIGASCFTKANMILCKTDYVRLFGNSGACSACGQTIPASEFVMRAGSGPGPGGAPGGGPQQQTQQPGGHHVFHVKCFACSKCGAQLMPGDRYCLLAGSLVCEQDWHKLLKGSGVAGAAATTTGTGVRKGKVGRPRRSRD